MSMDPQRRERTRLLGELIAAVTPDALLPANDDVFDAFYQALEHSTVTESVESVVFECLPVEEDEA